MQIASWNVNSIKARKEHVLKWLGNNPVDVLMIQELKGEAFPEEDFSSIGYHALWKGQKAYNGVAVLSKKKADLVLDTLPGDDSDEQARYLEIDMCVPPHPASPKGSATLSPAGRGKSGASREGEGAKNKLRLINIYAPNGNPVFEDLSSLRKQGSHAPNDKDPRLRGDDTFSVKYDYKLAWMERLYDRLAELRHEDIPFMIGGDFNVIPENKDCHDPSSWQGDALFRPETHNAFRAVLNLGLTDVFRVFNTEAQQYTFWDYQAGAWPKNHGIRIDHFLSSPLLTDRLTNCRIDAQPRGEDKASDHTPIIVDID